MKAALRFACQAAQHVGLAMNVHVSNMLCCIAVVALSWIQPGLLLRLHVHVSRLGSAAAPHGRGGFIWAPVGIAAYGECGQRDMARAVCCIGTWELTATGAWRVVSESCKLQAEWHLHCKNRSASVWNPRVPQASRACLCPAGTARVR